MAYTLPNNLSTGTEGIEAIVAYEAQQVPFLIPGILLFVFFVIAGAGYFAQDRRNGRANLPMWVAISGLITTTASFFLFLYDNLVNLEVVVIGMLVSILSALWFLLSFRE